jgi:DNA modification methylase
VIAAERLGRRCFAVERMPRFCDVIVKRWEAFTGKVAVRISREAQS